MSQPVSGLILSDFTIDTLQAYLVNLPHPPECNIRIGPYGPVVPLLTDNSAEIWEPRPDFTIVWTHVTSAIPSFQRLLQFEPVTEEQLIDECDTFINAAVHASTRTRFLFLMTWTLPAFMRGYGPIDHRSGLGWQHALLTLNKRAADRLSGIPNAFILNTARWTQTVGEHAFNPKLWYLSKIPFDPAVFKLAAQDIKAAMLACLGRSRKILLLDLDDTLWGGTVGETGWPALNIGGHNAVGESFADFQRALKALKNRGIILGIISKNEEAIALEAIDKHPEMILRRTDFAGWRINWEDKADNILSLLSELNLEMDAAVFIDNSPAERDRVHQALTDVLVPDWPEHSLLFTRTLSSLSCFDTIHVGDDDRARAQMYTAEAKRQESRTQTQDINAWLKSLNITVTVEPLSTGNLPRAAQLLNKTNQMNLSTRRLSEPEFLAWAKLPGHTVLTFRVSDHLGDSGLTGIISLEIDGNKGRIIDLVLSCRVFGRKLEELMTAVLMAHAAKLGAVTISARFVPTEKNKPCLDFLRDRSGFKSLPDNIFQWDTRRPYPYPAMITVKHDG